jgi:hypothetical protein
MEIGIHMWIKQSSYRVGDELLTSLVCLMSACLSGTDGGAPSSSAIDSFGHI